MGIFDWFRRCKTQTHSEPPEPKRQSAKPHAVVEFDGESITCRRSNGTVETIRWDHLEGVTIMTTSAGPLTDDVFFVLAGKDTGCVVPSEAEGSAELLRRLQTLPGFDNEAVIRAMACTDDATFLCWRREGHVE